jgi:iron complex outermembrane receptor protein
MKKTGCFFTLVCIFLIQGLQTAAPQETDGAGEIPAEKNADGENTESNEEEELYRLPEAEVTGERDTPELVTREEMERDNAKDLWEAVRYVPGVVLSGGGRRNDSNFTVRGYGADSIPVYVDGIPLANPYRGESDSARLLSGDLESIEIEKGYSSELLGANNLGGAILLRTAKPRDLFEASLKTGMTLDGIGHYADSNHVLNLGTRLDSFYAKTVVQYRDINHYRLSGDFEETTGNPQKPGDRLWSDSKDFKLTLMAGFTPVQELDTWFTVVYQDADKGISPPDVKTREYVIWDWPKWRRWSVSLNGLLDTGVVSTEALIYFDKYDNRLDEYYTMRAFEWGTHAPHSDYDEYSLGGRLKGSWEINSWNRLQTALTYKKENHRGLRGNIANDDMTEEMLVNEDTWSVGAEYAMNPWTPLTLKAGLGFDALIPLEYRSEENEYLKLQEADYFIVKTRKMRLYTWQFGLFYSPNSLHDIRVTYARKNHFPNMSQRYSTRFGSTLPNPNLGPEKAHHFELGYRFSLPQPDSNNFSFIVNSSLYYSIIMGKIVTVEIPNPHYSSALVDYSRNMDKTSFWGIELNPEMAISGWFNTGAAFSFNKYIINRSQNSVEKLAYYPEITLNGYMVIKPFAMLSIIPRVEYISSRYADTEGKTTLEGYFLAHLRLNAGIGKYVELSAGVENIFDAYYEIRQYSPMAGRSFTISITVKYR